MDLIDITNYFTPKQQSTHFWVTKGMFEVMKGISKEIKPFLALNENESTAY